MLVSPVIGDALKVLVGVFGGAILQEFRQRSQTKSDESVFRRLQEHMSRVDAPLFSAEDLRNSYFPKKSVIGVFKSLDRLEKIGLVRRLETGTLDEGPRIAWFPTDAR